MSSRNLEWLPASSSYRCLRIQGWLWRRIRIIKTPEWLRGYWARECSLKTSWTCKSWHPKLGINNLVPPVKTSVGTNIDIPVCGCIAYIVKAATPHCPRYSWVLPRNIPSMISKGEYGIPYFLLSYLKRMPARSPVRTKNMIAGP